MSDDRYRCSFDSVAEVCDPAAAWHSSVPAPEVDFPMTIGVVVLHRA